MKEITKVILIGIITAFNPCNLSFAQTHQLWGMTSVGGQDGAGVIFKTDGSGNNETVEHNFVIQNEGVNPDAFVQAFDGKFYGMTTAGGANGMGVLFQYDPSTNIYTKQLDFDGTANGSQPNGSLMQATDGKLYGMTYQGGANSMGVLFQYDPSTNIYTKKFDFDGTNGSKPLGSLIQASDGKLYGMTSIGGANGFGVIFQYETSTNTYTKKVDFVDTTIGRSPNGSLMQATDGKLYGMTFAGGANNFGIIFQYDPSTNICANKFDFDGAANGSTPSGSLMQASDGKLYGMTSAGGANTFGVIFRYNPTDSTYSKKFDFDGPANGSTPYGSLMQASDGKLYGMTYTGGQNGFGVIFQYDPSMNTEIKKYDFDGNNGSSPYDLMLASDGKLYGTTNTGGLFGSGILFQYTPSTNTFSKKFDFNISQNGITPYGSLMLASDGKLYGMTSGGGANGYGVILQYDPSTNIYAKKFDFDSTANGTTPTGSLIQSADGKLYGMTRLGGANGGFGVIFQYNPSTNIYTKKFDFNVTANGRSPNGSLIQASDGKLYGMTINGGANGYGVIFQYDPSANIYTKKFDFDGYNGGTNPFGSLMQATDGKLYGMTVGGGANNSGVLFQYDISTDTYTKEYDFNGTNGRNPYGSLMQASDGNLYGMASNGGANGKGVIFKYDLFANVYTNKFDFDSIPTGANPQGSLMQASDGKLYGVTKIGGTNGVGVLFNYDPSTSTYTKNFDFNNTLGAKPQFAYLIEINIATGIAENSFACTINIYPNPFTSQTTITFTQEQKNATLKIIDVLGKEVKTINFSGKQIIIEKGEMKAGIYFLQINDGNKNAVNRKIVLQ